MKTLAVLLLAFLMMPFASAQLDQATETAPDSAKTASHKSNKESSSANKPSEAAQPEAGKTAEKAKPEEAADKEEHYDVSEVPPVVTHHQIALNGKTLNYTATAREASS